MSVETLAAVVGACGAVLSLSMAAPQAVRIWHDRSYVGVSLLSWMLLSVTVSIWAGFSIRTRNPSLGAGNTTFLLACWCVILATLRADGYPRPRTVAVASGSALGAAGAVAIGFAGPLALVAVLTIVTSFVRVPQIVRSFGTWTMSGPSEISMLSLWIGFAGNCCWTLHGVFRADPLVTLVAALGALVAGCIIALELAAARRRARAEILKIASHSPKCGSTA